MFAHLVFRRVVSACTAHMHAQGLKQGGSTPFLGSRRAGSPALLAEILAQLSFKPK